MQYQKFPIEVYKQGRKGGLTTAQGVPSQAGTNSGLTVLGLTFNLQ